MHTHRPPSLRACVVDICDTSGSLSARRLKGAVERLFELVQSENPTLSCELVQAAPRHRGDAIPHDCDLYLCSGASGSPSEGSEPPWEAAFRRLLDVVVESNARASERPKALFGVCYSFELVVRHFGIARLARRIERRFGVWPVRLTTAGRAHRLFEGFGESPMAFEYRSWEAIIAGSSESGSMDARILACEDRGAGKTAVLAVDAAPGIEAVQFHPEMTPEDALAWLTGLGQAGALSAMYGEAVYEAMLTSARDPQGLVRMGTRLIPAWALRSFNVLAPISGCAVIDPKTAFDRDTDAG